MKNTFLIFCILLLAVSASCFGQKLNLDSLSKTNHYSNLSSFEPAFFLFAGKKSTKLLNASKEGPSEANSIDADWIDSLRVYKGESAVERYGSKFVNGVVVIYINQKDFDKLSSAIKERLN